MATTETAFVSEDIFTQESFRTWLRRRPASDLQHYELLHGRIVMSPPAGAWHGHIGSKLGAALSNHVQERGLGLTFDASTGFELPSGDTLEPDVAFVSRERWNAGPRPVANEFLRIVPSLVVEILSPSTERRDRTEKLEVYAENGVEEYWLIDLRRREVTVFARSRAGASFDDAVNVVAGRVPSALLPDLDMRVEELFSALA